MAQSYYFIYCPKHNFSVLFLFFEDFIPAYNVFWSYSPENYPTASAPPSSHLLRFFFIFFYYFFFLLTTRFSLCCPNTCGCGTIRNKFWFCFLKPNISCAFSVLDIVLYAFITIESYKYSGGLHEVWQSENNLREPVLSLSCRSHKLMPH